MHRPHLILAATLCLASTLSQAMPIVVTFVPTIEEQAVPGPKGQTGHYQFSLQAPDSLSHLLPAQPAGFGLANFPHLTGKPEAPEEPSPPALPKDVGKDLGQGHDKSDAFNGQDHANEHKPEKDRDTDNNPGSQVPEPGALALLMLGLSALGAMRLRQHPRA